MIIKSMRSGEHQQRAGLFGCWRNGLDLGISASGSGMASHRGMAP